jgi:demethylmenaquinone methyltransferase/2-methoxy-6-polyprenyl-1,4-benzoquinol methylase
VEAKMSYVYMKVLESAPERYDRGMRILLLGRLGRVHRDISSRVGPGQRVLDLGCGTGALAETLAQRGAAVTGIDISPAMLDVATRRLGDKGLGSQVTLLEMGAVDMDTTFESAHFDAVVATLMFSELQESEVNYVLEECRRVLKSGGQLLVADEVLPESVLGRLTTSVLRLPFVILAYVLTQTTTHRVAGLRSRIVGTGFQVLEVRRYLGGTLCLLVSEKGQRDA